ncbi:MAG: D-alanine--D-alanine ligase [Candidatus Marinimicrobia bacterium]|nr:D-alanine--D-alanine ligase [Candidatus Neomarinimicrobiota bacterium]MBL7010352.1 D-alanine--D-alanine ligase [Candidatus Neomarinimicrobiota bacterium]MBL7030020.1 D-alanine--D-alanine ligase [Candidatus Neomarinimicrobiota bacterium]
MKIAVLYGGNSAERDVSLSSGKAVIDACNVLGHDVVALDPANGMETMISDLLSVDLVFNGLHGGDGENGVIPGFLQSLGVKFTGSGNEASAICMDKRVSKALVHRKGISTPDWISIGKNEKIPTDNNLVYPIVVKPNDQGSTLGLTIVENASKLEAAITLAREYGNVILLEEFIAGRELTVTVIGGSSYPIVEIVPKHDLYDYDCKYTKGLTEYFCPADLPESLTKSIQESSVKIHQLFGCRHYSRVDFRLDENEKAWFLEVNTLPGMTETSLVPKSARATGLTFPDLIQKILDEAMQD